jgi:hypothetical protein
MVRLTGDTLETAMIEGELTESGENVRPMAAGEVRVTVQMGHSHVKLFKVREAGNRLRVCVIMKREQGELVCAKRQLGKMGQLSETGDKAYQSQIL